jgi:hypothetical protein
MTKRSAITMAAGLAPQAQDRAPGANGHDPPEGVRRAGSYDAGRPPPLQHRPRCRTEHWLKRIQRGREPGD